MRATKTNKAGLKSDKEQMYTETAYLGSILLGGKIAEDIKSCMFKYPSNQVIFAALEDLQKACVPDIQILCNHLSAAGDLDKVGGAAYIAELTNMCSPCNIGYFANDLSESYYRRSVKSILLSTQDDLANGKPLNEIIETVTQNTQAIAHRRNHNKKGLKNGISFNDLMQKPFSHTPWIVDNLISIGLTLLVGSSKIGKSWLALQLAIAIDKGGYLLGDLAAHMSGVVYFSLEDTEQRIKRRLTKLGCDVFHSAWLETAWKHGPAGLKLFLEENPQFKVVIIDTLQQFVQLNDIKDYTTTVNALSTLKHIADDFGIAIIAIHHTRKGGEKGSGDWMDSSLGSVGLNATADCTITLTRNRDSSDGSLRATGRDIEDVHWSLLWNKDTCLWARIGDVPKEKSLSGERRLIYQILAEFTNPASTAEIAEKAEKSTANTINILNKLLSYGLVTKVGRGSWELANSLVNDP